MLRVDALSGGFARPEACVELAKNPGIIASFSRALLEDLRHQMSDEEFNASLGGARSLSSLGLALGALVVVGLAARGIGKEAGVDAKPKAEATPTVDA